MLPSSDHSASHLDTVAGSLPHLSAGSRGDLAASREAQSDVLHATKEKRQRATAELATLKPARAVAEVEAIIRRAGKACGVENGTGKHNMYAEVAGPNRWSPGCLLPQGAFEATDKCIRFKGLTQKTGRAAGKGLYLKIRIVARRDHDDRHRRLGGRLASSSKAEPRSKVTGSSASPDSTRCA
jgi:hypothetical protein